MDMEIFCFVLNNAGSLNRTENLIQYYKIIIYGNSYIVCTSTDPITWYVLILNQLSDMYFY